MSYSYPVTNEMNLDIIFVLIQKFMDFLKIDGNTNEICIKIFIV